MTDQADQAGDTAWADEPGSPGPNVARIYDYLLGGKDHFAVDRQAAQRPIAALPDAPYVDRDLTAVRQAQALLPAGGEVIAFEGDAREPGAILASPAPGRSDRPGPAGMPAAGQHAALRHRHRGRHDRRDLPRADGPGKLPGHLARARPDWCPSPNGQPLSRACHRHSSRRRQSRRRRPCWPAWDGKSSRSEAVEFELIGGSAQVTPGR